MLPVSRGINFSVPSMPLFWGAWKETASNKPQTLQAGSSLSLGQNPLHSAIPSSGSTKTNPRTVWNGIVSYTVSKKHHPSSSSPAQIKELPMKNQIMSRAVSQFVRQLKWAAQVFPSKTPDLVTGKQELPSQLHQGHLHSTAEQAPLNIFHTLAELWPTDRDGNTNQSQQEPHNDNKWIKQPTEALQQLQTPKETLLPSVTFPSPLFHSQKKTSLKTC